MAWVDGSGRRRLDDPAYERLQEAAHPALSGYADAAGRVSFPAPALVAVGTRNPF